MKKLFGLIALVLSVHIATAQHTHTNAILGYTISFPSDWTYKVLDSVDTKKYDLWCSIYDHKTNTDDKAHDATSNMKDELFNDMALFVKKGYGSMTIGTQRGNLLRGAEDEYMVNFFEGLEETIAQSGLKIDNKRSSPEQIEQLQFTKYNYSILGIDDDKEYAKGMVYVYYKDDIAWIITMTYTSKEGKEIMLNTIKETVQTVQSK